MAMNVEMMSSDALEVNENVRNKQSDDDAI